MFATPRPIVLAGDSEATTPVLKDGSAFFCAGYFWNGESELYSITTATGQPQWQVRVGSCPHDGPSLVGSTVIALANQEHGTQHVAFGVDAASGRTLWTRDFGESTFNATLGDFLYVTTFDGPLLRVNAGTGEARNVEIARAPADPLWIVSSRDGLFVGSGTAVWSIVDPESAPTLRATLQSRVERVTAAAVDGTLLILQDRQQRLTAFDLADGRVRWRRGDRVVSPGAILGSRVFVNTFGPNRWELDALDAASGDVQWRVQGGFQLPTRAEERIYAAAGSSVLVVDEKTGRQIAQIPGSLEVVTSPIRAGDVVLYGTKDGVLHAARVPAP